MPTEPFPEPDDAEARPRVQGQAGRVLGMDARLDGPDAGGLGGLDERGQQSSPYAAAGGVGVDVDGVL